MSKTETLLKTRKVVNTGFEGVPGNVTLNHSHIYIPTGINHTIYFILYIY